jgi:hypothetical protein
VKPAISCASRLTLAVDATNLDAASNHLRDVSARERTSSCSRTRARWKTTASARSYGSTARSRTPIRKSRRLHGDHESVTHAAIDPRERDLAMRAVAAVGTDVLYARVDMVPDRTASRGSWSSS